jgi:predicted acetyltransferase
VSARLARLAPEHIDALLRSRTVSFGPAGEGDREYQLAAIERGDAWGWFDGDALLATLKLSMVDHWFGGRRVPCQNIASVAVPPEHRGQGVARAVMRAAVVHGAAEGAGLSLLFPATTRLYRGLGWEHSGEILRYRLDARQASTGGPTMRALDLEADWPEVLECHLAHGRTLCGPAVRPEVRWDHIRQADFAYGLDGVDGGLDAYVFYNQVRAEGDWQFTLDFVDWAAISHRGVTALLNLIGRHGTLGKAATFNGPAPHPFGFHIAEQDVQRRSGFAWMARGLDLGAAVAARGFPPGLTLDVAFVVEDDVLEEKARGPWRLEVAGGRGALTPAADASVRLNTRAVGPLYTGYLDAAALAAAGLATGPPDDLAALTTAFASPPPVLFDFF